MTRDSKPGPLAALAVGLALLLIPVSRVAADPPQGQDLSAGRSAKAWTLSAQRRRRCGSA